MQVFVDREPELRFIDETFNELLDNTRLKRNSIIGFYGVEGIGKTSLLRQIVQKCDEKQVRRIWAKADQHISEIEQNIIEEARRYILSPIDDTSALQLTRTLLDQGPLVMLLDAIDTTNESQLQWLETMLVELVQYNQFIMVLTSKRKIAFEREKSIARRLKSVLIEPFDRVNSEKYMDHLQVSHTLSTPLRDMIFDWTRGYPVAINAMVEAVRASDIMVGKRQIEVITAIIDHVIIDGILKNVGLEDQKWVKRVLQLLSIPRRFNLIIIQRLIEAFEPDLALPKSLSYIVLPNRITQATEVLNWKLEKAGFAVEEPVRHILLLEWRIKNPERYHEVSGFLAQLNRQNASTTTGSDLMRYQREYLYHSANSVDSEQLPQLLEETIKQIVKDAEVEPEILVQFVEEFERDSELQEALGKHATIAFHLLYDELAQKMYEDYLQEEDGEKRRRYLQNCFSYLSRDPAVRERPALLKERFLQFIEQEQGTSRLNELSKDLDRDANLKKIIGAEFAAIQKEIRNRLP